MKENDDMKLKEKSFCALGGLGLGVLLMQAIVFWTERYLAASPLAPLALFLLGLVWPVGSLLLRFSRPKFPKIWYDAVWFGWWFIPFGALGVYLSLA
jgi:hypothetical protein